MGVYQKPPRDSHPDDCSVMSYRGHTVLRTLIRCHFSPAETTGSQYIYSGSADGVVHVRFIHVSLENAITHLSYSQIWSVDGHLVQRINSRQSMGITAPPSGPEPELDPYEVPGQMAQSVVRDVSWHSQQPVLMSCAWGGDRIGRSRVSRHEWKGLGKLGGRLEDWVEKTQRESAEGLSSSYDGRASDMWF
jgi:DDB1- and CUL4-associated factor 11